MTSAREKPTAARTLEISEIQLLAERRSTPTSSMIPLTTDEAEEAFRDAPPGSAGGHQTRT
jgi:hypothetical protein